MQKNEGSNCRNNSTELLFVPSLWQKKPRKSKEEKSGLRYQQEWVHGETSTELYHTKTTPYPSTHSPQKEKNMQERNFFSSVQEAQIKKHQRNVKQTYTVHSMKETVHQRTWKNYWHKSERRFSVYMWNKNAQGKRKKKTQITTKQHITTTHHSCVLIVSSTQTASTKMLWLGKGWEIMSREYKRQKGVREGQSERERTGDYQNEKSNRFLNSLDLRTHTKKREKICSKKHPIIKMKKWQISEQFRSTHTQKKRENERKTSFLSEA